MPLDILGRTRHTMISSESFILTRKGLGNLVSTNRIRDRSLQLWILNEEFLVSAFHQNVLITSLLFVHTARRFYRVSGPVRYLNSVSLLIGEDYQTYPLRGRRSRNKVSVGEPAEGSLTQLIYLNLCSVWLLEFERMKIVIFLQTFIGKNI